MTRARPHPGTSLLAALVVLSACSRQERRLSERSQDSTVVPTAHAVAGPPEQRFLSNAWSLGEGQRLYRWFNCGGCHGGAGGGGIGPPLSDASFRYGGELRDVHASIAEGRPNGMPSFGPRVPDTLIWQLAAYVVSLGGR